MRFFPDGKRTGSRSTSGRAVCNGRRDVFFLFAIVVSFENQRCLSESGFFLRSVLTSNRHQTTWFCPSAATQLRAGLRLPIGCTTIQPVPRNGSCIVQRRSRGLLHPSQVRRTTNATKRHPGPRPSFVKLCRIFIWTTHVFSL